MGLWLAHQPPIALTVVAANLGVMTGGKRRPRRRMDRLDHRWHDRTECHRTGYREIAGMRTEQLHLSVDADAPTFGAGIGGTKSGEQ